MQPARMSKTCIIIVGPTAAGKTAMAIRLAQHLGTSIISCDSRQCFKELNIGVAKPTLGELEQVHHDFINSHSITETVNAAVFEQYALEKAAAIFQQHDTVVMVGGTGLYVKAFCEGMDEVPRVDEDVRQSVVEGYDAGGIEWLSNQLQQADPLFFSKGEMQNPQRMMRALEVKLSSGRSILAYQTGQKKTRSFSIKKIGIELPRPVLNGRINHRVDEMMNEGLLEEVKQLVPFRHLNALQTVGYRELFSYLDEEIGLDRAVESIKTNTRQYAKRQMTWFKKDASIRWCAPEFEAVLSLATQD